MVPVEQLSDNNFLNVYYIASEIKRELEITPDSIKHLGIRKTYAYNPNLPSYPTYYPNRIQTVQYLKSIGQLLNYYDMDYKISVEVVSQEIFFAFCNKVGNLYHNRFTKINAEKAKIDDLEEDQIHKLHKIIQVVTIRLSMSHSPHIIYIPVKHFPDEIQQYDLIGLLYKLDKDFDVLKFSKIVGEKPSEQEVEIRIADDKVSELNKLNIAVSERLQIIIKNKQISQQLAPVPVKKEPLEIKIVSGSKIEIENEEKLSKYKFPFSLPAGTEWKNIIFKFKDEKNAHIEVKQYKHDVNYSEMGFIGKGKVPESSEAWSFLRVLAELNGELAITDNEQKQKYKKQKEILSKKLKSYFNLDSDPFYPYEEQKSYRIKMTLLPASIKSKKTDPLPEEKDADVGMDDYYKELTEAS